MFGFGADMIFHIPALLIALTIHEYAHARIAVAFGDPTPRILGRMTLNPLAHLDPWGLLLLWLCRFGWAKPVPINPNNFTNWKKGLIAVSLAGPLANIFIALVCGFLLVLVHAHIITGGAADVVYYTYWDNLSFAVFNLIPLPPLDGSKVLGILLPGRQSYWLDRIEPYGPFILMGLAFTGIIGMFLFPIQRLLSDMINGFVVLVFQGVFLVLF